MMRSRPVKFMLFAACSERSSERAVKSAMEKPWVRASSSPPFADGRDEARGFFDSPGLVTGIGMVTARDSGRSRLPWQRGQVVADMNCIMYSR